MNEPREPLAPQEWDEVQRAYREAPKPAPSAGLDARVRAAVEAELVAAPARPAQVIVFPRWRRVAIPLAAAATIVVAVGVAWLGRTSTTGTPVLVASAPVPEAKEQPMEAARIADAASAAGTARKEERQEMLQAQVQRKAVAERPAALRLDMPPPIAAPAAPPLVTRSVPPVHVAELPGALLPAPAPEPAAASDRLMAAKPAPSQLNELRTAATVAAANGTLGEDAAVLPPPTLDQVRQLLRDRQREAARAQFKRWREAHPAEPVPDDLEALAAEAAR